MASKRTILMVCNYLMAGTAVVVCAYIFSLMFSSRQFGELPAVPQQYQSQISVPAVTAPPATTKEQASHALVSNGNASAGQAPAPSAGVQQARAEAPVSPTRTNASPWGDAPHVSAGPPTATVNRGLLPPGMENEDNSLLQAPQKIKK